MNTDSGHGKFWDMVDLARDDRERFTAGLQHMDGDDLARLCLEYERTVGNLKDEPYVAYMGNPSEDGADDIAYAIVAAGKAVYDDVEEHPERIPAVIAQLPPPAGFDARGAISKVYRQRFNESVFRAMARLEQEESGDEP
ncbi:hypothetical protein [Pseudoduganella umbonata]|uniref:DUF4240 domain-containing protein n=1 Tax=Pseudoduganella umbonata TaxID=864828 RepID=A0A7W5HAD8_9BURK|nr:hypothetical protein [Pseudoduganella umbonata]MBB3219822.1 hypothetical protein [Pseudoduganella umbonata]